MQGMSGELVSRRPWALPAAAAVLLAVAIAGCEPAREIVPEAYLPSDARDAYRHGLQQAGLAATALGFEWQAAADAALRAPVDVTLPYRERGAFDARQAQAFGYRFEVLRGQRVEVALRMDAAVPTVFLEVFRAAEGDGSMAAVASADPVTRRLAFEPTSDGIYLLRLQPELLRGGSFDLQVGIAASLSFPVQDHGVGDIQSSFGAARDAGRRSHHGVDIFAPRGTPVVAATRAFVRRVREQDLGGKVVWLHDQERGLHLYYAHLDAQLVEAGTWVNPGEVVGLVGNTGNARTTPPHLHFGIYAQGEGPVDPDPFLRPPRRRSTSIAVDLSLIGELAESEPDAAALRHRPDPRADALVTLPSGTALRVWAAAGDFYRVALDDGAAGFVRGIDVRRRAFPAADD